MNIFKNCFLILMVSSSLLLSGCERISAQENDKASLDITEMKTIEPPEDGWTYEQLNKVISINGITYDYPVTLGTLLETYTHDDSSYSDISGKAATIFYYNKKYAFVAALDYANNNIDNDSRLVSAIFTALDDESQIKSNELISINGVKIGDTYEKMIDQLGTPNIESENNYSCKYTIDNKIALAIYFFNSNEIQTIQVFWEE